MQVQREAVSEMITAHYIAVVRAAYLKCACCLHIDALCTINHSSDTEHCRLVDYDLRASARSKRREGIPQTRKMDPKPFLRLVVLAQGSIKLYRSYLIVVENISTRSWLQ